jgi:hypothetical protein
MEVQANGNLTAPSVAKDKESDFFWERLYFWQQYGISVIARPDHTGWSYRLQCNFYE